MFHPGWRERARAGLDRPFDLLVVGGGITGCGIALEAAQRGLRVLVVEKGDIASGTSSRSSKLIHGGLRYLKQVQLGLTRSSCRERDLQLQLSPHLVEAQPWIYPAYGDDATRGWTIDVGLWLYDRMTWGERHRHLDPGELEALAPGLPREGLDRALSYVDGRVDDARLTLAVAATAHAYGALVWTRAVVEEGLVAPGGRLRGLRVRDLEAGDVHDAEASLVVNAAGVWVDTVRHLLGREDRRLRPSRGSHLVFPVTSLPLGAAVARPSPDDGRPVFFIPHPEGVLVGTTDLFHDGPLDDPRPTSDEIGYLLRATVAAFPRAGVTLADAVGAFAGVRPVLTSDVADPSRASREEDFWEEDGLLTVAGGKLTTWRATAERAVDAALPLLPDGRGDRAAPCATAGTPLAGLAPRDLAARLVAAHGVEEAVATALARRLGSLAWTACEASTAEERRPLVDGLDLTAAEVRAHVRHGAALHLADLLLRRARYAMWQPAAAAELAPRVAEVMAAELGWDAGRRDAELERLASESAGWSLAGMERSVEAPR